MKFNENCITLIGILLSSEDIFNKEGENQVSTVDTKFNFWLLNLGCFFILFLNFKSFYCGLIRVRLVRCNRPCNVIAIT